MWAYTLLSQAYSHAKTESEREKDGGSLDGGSFHSGLEVRAKPGGLVIPLALPTLAPSPRALDCQALTAAAEGAIDMPPSQPTTGSWPQIK